jgi:hypothetical protein
MDAITSTSSASSLLPQASGPIPELDDTIASFLCETGLATTLEAFQLESGWTPTGSGADDISNHARTVAKLRKAILCGNGSCAHRLYKAMITEVCPSRAL